MANGPVLVVDFGAQYAQLIARRVREANVYSELVPHSMPVDEMLAKDPQAIILSGGPASVFEPGAPRVDPKLFDAGVPVLGICYGFQAMAYALGADVDKVQAGAAVGRDVIRAGNVLRDLFLLSLFLAEEADGVAFVIGTEIVDRPAVVRNLVIVDILGQRLGAGLLAGQQYR